MLTITRSYNSEAATDYFSHSLTTEGYYLDDNIKATWAGETSGLFGLKDELVSKNDFSNLVSNTHPITKERLTVRNVENRRAGFDLTFSAVKSVSVLYALTKDNNLLIAHRNAYRKAMLAIERDAQTQANTKEKRIYHTTGNIIYAAFDHFTSRPNEVFVDGKTEFVSDPQLHTHCYIPNVTWNETRKRFQALEIGNIHRLATYYESLYHSYFTKELTNLGFSIERTTNRYEIAGIPRSIIERFSNRSLAIEQVAKEKGITNAKTKAELGKLTRNSKSTSLNEKELFKIWKNRLSDSELKSLYDVRKKTKPIKQKLSAKEAVDRAIEHFEERQSAYQEKRIIAHALNLGYGYFTPEIIENELKNRSNILRAEIDSVTYMTTKEMVLAENRMIQIASRGKGTTNPIHQNYITKQDFLNGEQKNAIHTLLESFDAVTILKGTAGVGKTSLLTEVNEAVKEKNKTLIALAPSSQATKQLESKGFKATTIAGFLTDTSKQKELKNNVLLVDEAGMVGVKTMTELLELGKKQNAKVILSGDTKQHNSIEFGDSLRILEEKAKLKTARVSKIVRQKPEAYRKIVEKLAQGKIMEGYHHLDKIGAILEIPEQDKRINKIAEEYVESIKQKKSTLIISPTNHEGETISATVREKLKTEGIIEGKERQMTSLKNLSLTESQKKDKTIYREGQILRFIRNQKGGYKAGQHYEILKKENEKLLEIRDTKTGEVVPLPYKSPENYQVFEASKILLAKGDSIRLTQNSKSIENSKMNNGTVYQIKGFTRSGDLKLSNNKTLSKENGHFKHAYSETSYSSQGKDADQVILSMSDMSLAGVSREQFYVSASRGKKGIKLFVSDKEELKKSLVRSNERMTADEIVKKRRIDRQFEYRQQKKYHESLKHAEINKNQHKKRQKDTETIPTIK